MSERGGIPIPPQPTTLAMSTRHARLLFLSFFRAERIADTLCATHPCCLGPIDKQTQSVDTATFTYTSVISRIRFDEMWVLFARRLSYSLGQLTPKEIVATAEELAVCPLRDSDKYLLLKDIAKELAEENTFLVASLSPEQIERLAYSAAIICTPGAH